MKTIETAELKTLVSGNQAVIAEALPARYFEQGHLPKAINIPLDATDEMIMRALADASKTVVTYCTGFTCPNSRKLAVRLELLGFKDVRAYEGGKEAWTQSGLHLEASSQQVSK